MKILELLILAALGISINADNLRGVRSLVPDLGECPSDFPDNNEDNNGRCFYVSDSRENAKDAQAHCIKLGGRLFEPKSQEENDQIKESLIAKAKAAKYYIGVNDQEN